MAPLGREVNLRIVNVGFRRFRSRCPHQPGRVTPKLSGSHAASNPRPNTGRSCTRTGLFAPPRAASRSRGLRGEISLPQSPGGRAPPSASPWRSAGRAARKGLIVSQFRSRHRGRSNSGSGRLPGVSRVVGGLSAILAEARAHRLPVIRSDGRGTTPPGNPRPAPPLQHPRENPVDAVPFPSFPNVGLRANVLRDSPNVARRL